LEQFQIWKEGNDSAYLASDLFPFVEHLDRGAAIAHGLLTALFNGTDGEIQERIASQVGQIQAERSEKYSSGTFLIFHGVREIPKVKPEFVRQGPTFNVAFDAIDKPAMREQFRPELIRSVSSVALALGDRADPRISKVTDGLFLIEPDSGKPIYSFSFSASAPRISIGTMLDDATGNRILHYADKLGDERNINRILDQLIQSLAHDTDEFRAFLSSWTALEIFVTSTFSRTYEKLWFDKLRRATPPSTVRYFDHVQDVMSRAHRLVDKFIVISSLLDPHSALVDIAQFKSLKKVRDAVFHGADEEGANYPTETTHELVTKYLRLHLDRDVQNFTDQSPI
jgi:hypothetical protein